MMAKTVLDSIKELPGNDPVPYTARMKTLTMKCLTAGKRRKSFKLGQEARANRNAIGKAEE